MGSPRKVLMDTLRILADESRSGAYFVKRGAIDWATFAFASHPRAIALMADHMGLLQVDGMRPVSVGIEMAARMPETTDPPEIDDGLMDEMIEDVEEIVYGLQSQKDDRGDTVAFRVDPRESSIREFHDVSLRVQGIVAQFNVKV